MQIRITKKNINDQELARAIAGIATDEGVGQEVQEILGRLIKADHPQDGEKIPEKYMRYIGDQLISEFKTLLSVLTENVEIWMSDQSRERRSVFKSLSKASDSIPFLSQEQMDELRALIESHFRSAIGLGYTVPEDLKKKWQKMGLKNSNVDLEEWIVRSYVAGRLADALTNSTTYADLNKLIRGHVMSRQDKLIIQLSKQNSARFIVGYGEKLGGLATDVVLDQHKKSINSIIQKYFSGELTREAHSDSGFSPEEESVIRKVSSWRELASELRDRFKQTDLVRDWERVAFTEMRYASNLGRLTNIQHEGGGDAEDVEVFYHVLPTACNSCKKLYLNPDGVPKIFKLSEILHNVAETGGMNVGRKASTIGQADGWLPNAVVHPNCHCYPVRKIGGYEYAEFQ